MNAMKKILKVFCLYFLFGSFFLIDGYSIPIVPLQKIMEHNNAIQMQKIEDEIPFDLPEFTMIPDMKTKGAFCESFLYTIPGATVRSMVGLIEVNRCLVQDFLWADQWSQFRRFKFVPDDRILHASGRLAVITNPACINYYHWMCEVLGRLAFLEMNKVEYDYLYVPCTKSFMKQTLSLWGVDGAKIVQPVSDEFCVQADTVIIPSSVINTTLGFKDFVGSYMHPTAAKYVRNKLLNAVQSQPETCAFNKKVFISRQDTSYRRIINEDDLFKQLQLLGFERYELATMSVADQIRLFNNADIIVAPHGAGMINAMFCNPGTKIVEIFQAMVDSTYWYISHLFNLEYYPIKTVDMSFDQFFNCRKHWQEYTIALKLDTYISEQSIQEILDIVTT